MSRDCQFQRLIHCMFLKAHLDGSKFIPLKNGKCMPKRKGVLFQSSPIDCIESLGVHSPRLAANSSYRQKPVSRKPDWIPCQAWNDGPGEKTIPRCFRLGRSLLMDLFYRLNVMIKRKLKYCETKWGCALICRP